LEVVLLTRKWLVVGALAAVALLFVLAVYSGSLDFWLHDQVVD
jgi:hypothetical protein